MPRLSASSPGDFVYIDDYEADARAGVAAATPLQRGVDAARARRVDAAPARCRGEPRLYGDRPGEAGRVCRVISPRRASISGAHTHDDALRDYSLIIG